MKLYGLEKLSLVDYDGKICATVFTGACNFRCGFCHNGPLVVDYKTQPFLSEEYILDYLKSRVKVLDGVCITGGEPTLNPDLLDFCKKLKDLGYSVKLDSNGTNPKMLEDLIDNNLIDYIAMDVKSCKEQYAKVIGLKEYDTKIVEQSVDLLLKNKVEYEFRTTLIKEYHTPEVMQKIGDWIRGAKKYCMQKYNDRETCIAHGYTAVDEQTAQTYKTILSNYLPNVILRGY